MANDESIAEVVNEIGIYVLPGRVRDPERGLREVVDAERLGFRRAWLAERYDLKDGGVLLGAAAALTSRIGLGTAVLADCVRHPLMTASLGATMQSAFGDRLVLGLGRGVRSTLEPLGFRWSTQRDFEDYVVLLKRLWAGETINYDGPLGKFPVLTMSDRLTGRPPELVYGTMANERGIDLAAKHFDGAMLVPFLTVSAVRDAVTRLRAACERHGRDPDRFRIYHVVVTAPDFDRQHELSVVHARAVTYFQIRGDGDRLAIRNGWDLEPIARLRQHPVFRAMRTEVADRHFHRDDLLDAARLIPDEWMADGAALGSAKDCCERLEAYLDAGADEIIIHGSSPAENAEILRIWRERHPPRVAA